MNYDRMHDWLVNYFSKSKTIVVPMPFTTYTYIADPANVEHVLKTNFNNYPKALKLSTILCQVSFLNHEIDMQELLMRMTLDSICKVGFGVEIGTLAPNLPENSYAHAFDTANIIVTLRFIDPLRKIKKMLSIGSEVQLEKSIKVIDDFTYSVKQDILSRFIELGESNATDKSLKDVVLNFAIAGRDTTAPTLSWAIYMFMTHAHVADKLYLELKKFEENRANEEHFLASIEITETLRLYPAVPQDPKGILEDDVLPDGTKIKAGGMVTYVPYSVGRMEYNWGPDAASFVPERWFKDRVLKTESPFKFTAFQDQGICLGKDSAYLQMRMGLAILCRFYKFNLVPDHVVKYRMMTILSMAYGLKLTIERRS
ncbi:Cytochrome P450 704B1 [Glycine soja]|uniref:Cytochrome P450 n=2 Tax=Glycine subgen. Soja TaxID=1462606 RepID=K7MEK7_SOYBN|nr:Cytochrome P450 704B1 [Glycine soja]